MTSTTTSRNAAWETLAIWTVQFFGIAALAAFAYSWLTWPDEHGWQVIASLACAVVFVLVVAWLQCATLARFAYADDCIGSVFVRSLRRLPAFILWMILLAGLAWLLIWSARIAPQSSVRVAQVLHLSPRLVLSITNWKLFALWLIFPALLLPLGAAAATNGFAAWTGNGLRTAFRPLRSLRYWLVFAVASLIGIYLPYKLIHWLPAEPRTLKQEAWHMGLRFLLAYVLIITAWIGFTRFLGGRTTREKLAE